MKKVFTFIFLLCMNFNLANARIDVFFTPSKKCENSIISLIEESQKTIDIVVYAINNDQIVDALKVAHDRGIKIRILADRLQASLKFSRVIELHNYGINVRVHSKNKIEHNKFAIFDGIKASTGSYNWTNQASNKNSENCLFVIDDQEVISKYSGRFNYLWQINTKHKSDKWFERKNI